MLFDKKFEGNDPIYRSACVSSYPDKVMQKLEDLWAKFKPYADEGFEQLFRDDLVSRFWEMYLGVMLLQEKKVLEKKSEYGPDTYIIAINASKLGFPDVFKNPPYIIKSVFPIGLPYARINVNSGNIIGRGYNHREYIIKKSGSQVETKIFLNKKYSGISAII